MLKRCLFFLCFAAAPLLSNTLELSGNHLDEPLMQKLISLFHPDTVVETGTYQGTTAALASRYFQEVHTIELSHKLFEKASQSLKSIPNIRCYEGHSGTVISRIGSKLKGRTLFWLDAHYSGGNTAKGTSNSAIRDELAAIKKCGLKNAIILIDDIRGFQGKGEEVAFYGGFPSIKELKALVLSINPEYEFWILGDIAIAYPKSENVTVSPLVKACTLSRIFESRDTDVQAVMAEEMQLKNNAHTAEAGVIESLHEVYFVQAGETASVMHYLLWEGLISSGKGSYAKAIDCFKKAISFGYDHWRVYWYLANAQYEAQDLKGARTSLEKVVKAAPDFKEALELRIKLLEAAEPS